jgi:hypothetical protein
VDEVIDAPLRASQNAGDLLDASDVGVFGQGQDSFDLVVLALGTGVLLT